MDAIHKEMRTVRVAAVQMSAKLGDIQANLNHANAFVEQAAQKGAQLVVLPELAACGYAMATVLWDSAETKQGITVQWACKTAHQLGVYLGIGFIEADGEDFYNTYVFCQPDGRVAAFVRKTMAETCIFKCASGQQAIQTSLGKIGIGICADNQFAPHIRRMQQQSVDLLLMPHAWPGAFKEGGLVSQADIRETRQKACEMASLYVHLLGVPAVFINHVGPRGPEKWAGLLGGMMDPKVFRFLGLSTIADADGTVKAQMDDCEEGFIAADVTLDPAKRVFSEPKHYGSYGGGWLRPHNPLLDVICHVDAFGGRLSYTLSGERKSKARRISASYAHGREDR